MNKRIKAFEKIYNEGFWGDGVNSPVSGWGSTLDFTANIRKELPKLFKKYHITSVLDAPCGDLTWMIEIINTYPMQYIGADIVSDLIKKLQEQYANTSTHFIPLDICTDPLPNADVFLCRDCMFHLPPKDIIAVFQNFVDSNIPYILATTHTYETVIASGEKFGGNTTHAEPGEWWLLNLHAPPYNLPPPIENIQDCPGSPSQKDLSLWTKQQIIGIL